MKHFQRKTLSVALCSLLSASCFAQSLSPINTNTTLPADDPYDVTTRPITGSNKAQVKVVNDVLRDAGTLVTRRANGFTNYRRDAMANLPASFSKIEIYNPNSYEIMGMKILNFGLPSVDLSSYMAYCSYANTAAQDFNRDNLNPVSVAHDKVIAELNKVSAGLGEPFKKNAYDAVDLNQKVSMYADNLKNAIQAYNDSKNIKLGAQDVDYFLQETVSALKDGAGIGIGIATAAGSTLISADDLAKIGGLTYPLTLPGGEYPIESAEEMAGILKMLQEGFGFFPEFVDLLKKVSDGKTPSETALALVKVMDFTIKKLDYVMKEVDGRTRVKKEFNKSKTGSGIATALAKLAVDREKLVKAANNFRDAQSFKPNSVQAGCWTDMSSHIHSSLKMEAIFATTSLLGDLYNLGKKVSSSLTSKSASDNKNPATKKIQGFIGLAEAGVSSVSTVIAHINTTDNRIAGLKYYRQLESDKLLYSQFELALNQVKNSYGNVCKVGIKPLLDRSRFGVSAVPKDVGECYNVVTDFGGAPPVVAAPTNPPAQPPAPPNPAPTPIKGTLTSADNQVATVNGSVTIAGTATGREPVRVQVLYSVPGIAQPTAKNADRNSQTGAWTQIQPFYGAGVFTYTVQVADASGATAIEIGKGKVTVTDVGKPTPRPVDVVAPPTQPVQPPSLVDGMKFENIETVPDDTVVSAGASFLKSWTVRNSGTTTWNNGYCLKPISGESLAPPATSLCVQRSVAPNSTYTFSTTMNAPGARDVLTTYKQTWALMNGQRNLGLLTVQIKVNALTRTVQSPLQPPFQPTPVPLTPSPVVSTTPPAPAPGANVQSISPLSGALGSKVQFTVSGSQLPVTIKLELSGEQCGSPLFGDMTKRTFECTVSNAGSPKSLTVKTLQGATLKSEIFTVINNNNGGNNAPTLPAPITALIPQLNAGASIASGQAWSARLTTNMPIYSADLIFATGRRIPFDGAAQQWETRDINSKLNEAGTFSYTLQIRRAATSPVETFPGGTLEVRAPIIPTNAPVITSANSLVQGNAYNLTVQTNASADRVMVQWPDVGNEQGLGATNAQRTQFAFGSRLFNQLGAVNYTVRTYKDGVTAPTGQVTGVLNITPQAASIRLLEISKDIIVGESPYFTVESSLAVARVTVQIGGYAAVELVGAGPGSASQIFRAKVLASQVGVAVPYTITGYNAQGQALGTRITGTLVVAGVSDSLNVPSPVPVGGISLGEYVSWRFGTFKNPDQMVMEFSAPIGNVQLEGAFFKHTFNYPVGTYKYKLMRKDYLGNVFAIQGASGDLVIKPKAVDAGPLIKQITINGQKIVNGSTVQVKISSTLEALVDAPIGKSIVFKLYVQPFGEVLFRMQSNVNGIWRSDMGGNKTVGDYLRGQAKPGNVAAKIYIDTGGTNVNTNLGGTVDFTVQLVP